MLRILTAASAMASLSACATTDNEPIDASAFVAATPVEDRADYPVEIVETVETLHDDTLGAQVVAPDPLEQRRVVHPLDEYPTGPCRPGPGAWRRP